ncbi:hypothetical protein ACIP9X_17350 [Arthrobacter sp. NPDC093125]|uniref:hypothetical protein n=1 Tax=Arthrobacter sp. NPDC093125 TaxID=3363944 RepID=UPI003823744D
MTTFPIAAFYAGAPGRAFRGAVGKSDPELMSAEIGKSADPVGATGQVDGRWA